MIAGGPYVRLLRLPQVRKLLISSVVGLIPVGLTTLALVLFLQSPLGSLTDAGVAGACYFLGLAFMTPVVGRAVDRIGPRPVLITCVTLCPVALVTLVTIVLTDAPAPGYSQQRLLRAARFRRLRCACVHSIRDWLLTYPRSAPPTRSTRQSSKSFF